MEQELFGESSASAEEEDEDEDSSEESSGEEEEEDNEKDGEQAEGKGERVDGGMDGGVQAVQDSSSSSSSGDSGSGSEGEESVAGGDGKEEQPSPEPSPSHSPPPHTSRLRKTQDLFGGEDTSSSSSGSESGEGEGVTGDGVSGEGGDGESDKMEGEGESPITKADESPSADNDDGISKPDGGPSQTVEGLFGDAADLSSSDDAGEGVSGEREVGEGEGRGGGEEAGAGEGEVPRINVEIPRCMANLGSEQYFVKLPNFLSVETRPFDPALYEDEVEDESEILDEEGRARLKLKVENTIRWRYSQDETGSEVRESNARVVRWSDGSMSLYLGGEIFDIHRQPLQGEFSHLFVRQGTGLQGQAVFHSKLTFRPHSTDSQTHRKMTLSIADRFSKTQKIRVLPAVGKDPESQKKEKIKKEEEKLRAAVRRENQQRRMRERHSQRGLTAGYLEPDREDDEGFSLSAIKSSVRGRLSEGRAGRGGESEGEEGESSDEGAERLMRAKADEVEPVKSSKKHHLDAPPEAESRRKQPRRKFLHSDDESSD